MYEEAIHSVVTVTQVFDVYHSLKSPWYKPKWMLWQTVVLVKTVGKTYCQLIIVIKINCIDWWSEIELYLARFVDLMDTPNVYLRN